MTKESKAGRPKTRDRESFMLAIWSAVQEEKHCRNANISIRQACVRLFENRADGLIKFVDKDGTLIDVISGAAGAETLRQRYQIAERCRHDAERYPMLHARSKHLLEILPGTFEKVKAGKAEIQHLKNTGKWPL
jgi:hypothetical protein